MLLLDALKPGTELKHWLWIKVSHSSWHLYYTQLETGWSERRGDKENMEVGKEGTLTRNLVRWQKQKKNTQIKRGRRSPGLTAGTARCVLSWARQGTPIGRTWKLLRKRWRSNRKLSNSHRAGAERKADSRTKVNSQVMVCCAKRRE